VWQKSLPNKDELNSCLSYYCHVGDVTDRKTRVSLKLLANILQEPFYKQLRTVEQLGYAVGSGYAVWTASIGLLISIQSERDPTYCETRLDAFLEMMAGYFRNLPHKDFEERKSALIVDLEGTDQNLEGEGLRFWREIKSGYNDFRSREYTNWCSDIPIYDLICRTT